MAQAAGVQNQGNSGGNQDQDKSNNMGQSNDGSTQPPGNFG
jgi:hypothetical protein